MWNVLAIYDEFEDHLCGPWKGRMDWASPMSLSRHFDNLLDRVYNRDSRLDCYRFEMGRDAFDLE